MENSLVNSHAYCYTIAPEPDEQSWTMHRYTPVTHSEGGGVEDEVPQIAVPPTNIRSLATTALLMLLSGIAGALILAVIQSHASTVSMSAPTPELERLQDLLSGMHKIGSNHSARRA